MTDQINPDPIQNNIPAAVQQLDPNLPHDMVKSNSDKHIDLTTVEKISKRMTIMTELGLLGMIVILALIFMFGYLAKSQVNQFQINRQQIAAAMFNGSDIQNTVTFLENQQNQIDIINKALPNESGFIDFVKTLEVLSSDFDNASGFQFDRGKTLDGVSYVPVTITLKTTSTNIITFLERLEKIPYLFVIDSIAANKDIESEDNWSYVLTGKVFVSNNFRES